MLKKLSIAIVYGLFVSTAQASDFNGFYVGGSVGDESDHYNLTDTGTGSLAGISFSNDMGAESVAGGIFAGYGRRFGNLYLGAEAQGDVMDAESNTTLTDGGSSVFIKLKHDYDYGAAVRAGIFPVDNTLLYGKVGVLWGRFEDTAVNDSQTLAGAQFGLGAETELNSNLTIRADWTYVSYESASYSDAFQTGSTSPTSNTFKVGLAYNF
jgi:opacity protein-like surface antigen